MKHVCGLLLAACLWTGCDTLKGPNESDVAPAVEGRVVDAVSGAPLPDARVQRYLSEPKPSDPLKEHGAERLFTVPSVRSDAEGRFRIDSAKGGYLMFARPGVFGFTLVVRHPTHQTLTTNIDLLKFKPVKTNGVLTTLVGDLPLDPKQE